MPDVDELAEIRAHCDLLHTAARAGRLAQLGRHDAYACESRCAICRSEPGEKRFKDRLTYHNWPTRVWVIV
jgi:hypothetical protein